MLVRVLALEFCVLLNVNKIVISIDLLDIYVYSTKGYIDYLPFLLQKDKNQDGVDSQHYRNLYIEESLKMKVKRMGRVGDFSK